MTTIVGLAQNIKRFLIQNSKELIPRIDRKIFIGLLIFGYAIHSFRLTQMLNGADDIQVLMRGYGAGITSGRWALEYLGNLINWKWQVGSFNLSVFDGLLTIFFLCLSICIVLELFNLRHSKLAILFAAVFMVYPVCSATFLFMFTAAYYGLSCLLAVLAAYYIKTCNKLYGVFAIVCIAVSIGLYQAYFPMTVTLCLLLMIDYFLKENADIKTGIKRGIYYLAIMCLGVALYFVALFYCLNRFGTELASYKGIDSMGQWGGRQIYGLITKCYDIFLHLPVSTYHSINTLQITRMCILSLYIFSIILVIISIVNKKYLGRIIIIPLIFLLPIAVNLIEIMSKNNGVYELMIYPTVFIFFLPILLFERNRLVGGIARVLHRLSGLAVALVLVLSILCYSWHANWNYVALDYMNRETESYFTTLVTRIKSAENYKDEYPVLFVGEDHFVDLHFMNPYSIYPELYFECNPQGLIYSFSWKSALSAYTGFQCGTPSNEECEKIFLSEKFKAMNNYPDDGSIKVIDEVIVIKITD